MKQTRETWLIDHCLYSLLDASSAYLTSSDSQIPSRCNLSLGENSAHVAPSQKRMQTIKRISTSFGRPVSPPANEIRARLEEFGEDVHCVKNLLGESGARCQSYIVAASVTNRRNPTGGWWRVEMSGTVLVDGSAD